MSPQPIPKKIAEKQNISEEIPTYTLLIDGNSLLETCFHADPKINSKGVHYGGVFQFLLQMKILLSKRDFNYIYCFWDGDNSGELRNQIYPEYKLNRDKNYSIDNVSSDYYKDIDKFVKSVLNKRNKEKTPEKITEKEHFYRQRNILQEYLEELFIRQVSCEKIEGDDLIAYYCINKKDNDRIYIVSGDMDLTQLIDDYICLYVPRMKKFITKDNHIKELGYSHKNVLLKKMICGDASDNIKGVKGIGEKTLFEIMPEIKYREVKLYEVIARCRELNEGRKVDKKKPIAAYDNIINGTTNGIHNGKMYEINNKIINLKEPLMSQDSIELMEDLMYVVIDPEGRSMSNLYKMILRDNIDELINENKFSTFFSTFNKSIDKEKKYYNKWLEENN